MIEVAEVYEHHPMDSRVKGPIDIMSTVSTEMRAGGNNMPLVHCYTITGNVIGRHGKNGGHQLGVGKDVMFTLNTADRHAVVGALCARDYKGVGNEYVQENKCQIQENTVRRLTPLECERLQGYPDGWTDIEFHGKPAPDTRRYKAIGNGMAQPCADFVIRRIAELS